MELQPRRRVPAAAAAAAAAAARVAPRGGQLYAQRRLREECASDVRVLFGEEEAHQLEQPRERRVEVAGHRQVEGCHVRRARPAAAAPAAAVPAAAVPAAAVPAAAAVLPAAVAAVAADLGTAAAAGCRCCPLCYCPPRYCSPHWQRAGPLRRVRHLHIALKQRPQQRVEQRPITASPAPAPAPATATALDTAAPSTATAASASPAAAASVASAAASSAAGVGVGVGCLLSRGDGSRGNRVSEAAHIRIVMPGRDEARHVERVA